METLTNQLENLSVRREARKLRLPAQAWAKLKPHQKTGVTWLAKKYVGGEGCILGDDMGLGKTVQVSIMAGCVVRDGGWVLVAVPPSLQEHWKQHLRSWGDVEAVDLKDVAKGGSGVVVLSTGVVSKALSVDWDYIVVDEVHKAKNPSTNIYKNLARLEGVRLGLTGTILQNSLMELHTLLNWATNGRFFASRTEFEDVIAVPVTQSKHKDASFLERAQGKECLAMLHDELAKHHLRRTKEQLGVVKTTKRDVLVWLELNNRQKELYTKVWRGNHANHMVMMTELQKVCNHLWATAPSHVLSKRCETDEDTLPGMEDLGTVVTGGIKMQFLKEVLEEHGEKGDKWLVFSKSTVVLDVLEVFFAQMGKSCSRLDGTMAVKKRQGIVDHFNETSTVDVLLLTIQVGGVGLNLTAANKVLLYDTAWNPATDKQGVDRAYRMGQDRDVTVIRLLTAGTLEDYMFRRSAFKEGVSKAATSTEQTKNLFTEEDVKRMSRMDFNTATTAKQLDKLSGDTCADVGTTVLQSTLKVMDGVLAVTDYNELFRDKNKPREDEPVQTPTGGEGEWEDVFQLIETSEVPTSPASSSCTYASSSSSSNGDEESEESTTNPLANLVGGAIEVLRHISKQPAYESLTPSDQDLLKRTLDDAFSASEPALAFGYITDVTDMMRVHGASTGKLDRMVQNLFPDFCE